MTKKKKKCCASALHPPSKHPAVEVNTEPVCFILPPFRDAQGNIIPLMAVIKAASLCYLDTLAPISVLSRTLCASPACRARVKRTGPQGRTRCIFDERGAGVDGRRGWDGCSSKHKAATVLYRPPCRVAPSIHPPPQKSAAHLVHYAGPSLYFTRECGPPSGIISQPS